MYSGCYSRIASQLSLESEAATIFTYKSNQNLFHPGRKFIVVNAGGENKYRTTCIYKWYSEKHALASQFFLSPTPLVLKYVSEYSQITRRDSGINENVICMTNSFVSQLLFYV